MRLGPVERLLLLWTAFLVALFFLWSSLPSQEPELIVCDVGQGDALLYQVGFLQFLLDTGPDESVLGCLGSYMPAADTHIELLLLTHADNDHIGGVEAVLNQYHVEKIILPVIPAESQVFDRLKNGLFHSKQATKAFLPHAGQVLIFPQGTRLKLEIPHSEMLPTQAWKGPLTEETLEDYWRQAQASGLQRNAASIVSFLEVDSRKLLLTGDIGEEEEESLMRGGLIEKIWLLKAAHHGSKYSNSPAFLRETRPEVVVVSAGKGNSHGHPHPEVIERFTAIGARILRTDLQGSLRIPLNFDPF